MGVYLAHQVSLLSLVTGIVAGVMFYFQDNLSVIIWACFFITLSGFLDSADGQLARMTNTASDFGRKVDAIIDTLVFAACYMAGTLYLLPTYGWPIILVAVLAGYLHSGKSAAYEFYKMEFVLYTKQSKSNWIASIDEVRKNSKKEGIANRLLYAVEVDYTRKQALFVTRTYDERLAFYDWAFGEKSELFVRLYKKYNHKILTPWALICGTNMHRNYLMVCSLFGRIDIYFVLVIVTFLPMIWVSYKQKKHDELLRAEMVKLESLP